MAKNPEGTASGATFANTRQHVADRQSGGQATERFANTKNNIALINDPNRGPRFTLTKQQSGLADKSDAEPPASAPVREAAPPPGTEPAASKAKTEAEAPPSTAAARTADPLPAPAADAPEPAGKDAPAPRSALLGVPPGHEPPSKVPVDSSKTFVGPNGTYYDETWRWMDWRGERQSWNWPAALTFGHWFAYRRLHGFAGLYLVWLGVLAWAAVNDVHLALVAGMAVLVAALSGLYANTLYLRMFRRAVAHVTEKGEGSYTELQAQLAKAGGVQPLAPKAMAALTALVVAIVLLVTHNQRGGFAINIWPL